MKSKMKLSGQLRSYLRWPLILSILMLVMNIGMYFVDVMAGMWFTLFFAVYVIAAAVLYYRQRPQVINELITFATEYGQVQKHLIQELALPYAVMDSQGKLLWVNKEFTKITGKDTQYHKCIATIFPELTVERLPKNEEEIDIDVAYGEKNFRAHVKSVCIDELIQNSEMINTDIKGYFIQALYLFDETELREYMRKFEDETMVTGLLYLDNYDEALESVEEVRRSLLTALVERKINKYFNDLDGLVKRYENDKYIVVMRRSSLNELKEKKFDILEDVKTINIGNEMAVTISMGIGADAGSFAKNSEYAKIAIDLALGRGGDQVVVKNGEDIAYFGGKAKQVERNTRVKARVKAHALHEIIESRENVIIMGHSLTDVDSLGAGIGIFCAARVLGKKAQIVINEPTTSIRPLMECFTPEKGYPEDMFINSEIAIEEVSRNSLVMVVDTNRPSYTECPELLTRTDTIVVFDHHRQGSEVIENPLLSYIEPYASSACEMVAEVLQYFQEGFKLSPAEADCIYAGILIDTNNFMTKTGVRTFEAAAYLRRSGAEVTRVRKMLRNDMACYKARAEAVRHAEVYRGAFAISVCPSEDVESPTIVGAQAANELLNIIGIKASFVLTEYAGKIYISSRSIDEINVQLIMERMGGGGHLNVAGAQLTGCTISEAKHAIMRTIDEMLEEGDIQE